MTTQSQEKTTDFEKQERLDELYSKKERNADEQKEFDELKKERGSSFQKKIDMVISEKKELEHLYGKQSKEVEEMRQEIEELKQKENARPKEIVKETVKVGDKEWFTDSTLQKMIEGKEISESDAWAYKSKRDKEEVILEAVNRIEGKKNQETEVSLRTKDQEWVIENYPYFKKGHKDHNPDDELYKLADELFKESYYLDPQGLSKSIKRAEKILGKSARIDVSDDLSMRRSRGEDGHTKKSDNLSLSEDEKEIAHRMYNMSGTVNPKTGRVYTKDEAESRALEGKKKRLESRRIL